jgi:hypothetical protein
MSTVGGARLPNDQGSFAKGPAFDEDRLCQSSSFAEPHSIVFHAPVVRKQGYEF